MIPDLSVIVVSFNTSELTCAAVDSLIKNSPGLSLQIIVFDNSSSDSSADSLQVMFGDRIKIIKSNVNLGFAKANNLASAYVSSDYILLLNPDTVVNMGSISNLLAFSDRYPTAKIWGGRTLFGDGSLNPFSCWMRQTVWSLVSQAFGLSSVFRHSTFFNPEGIGGWDRIGCRQVDIVSGCFLLIRRDFWNQLGGFAEEFFMYGEEADLCLRAHKFGAKPMVTSDATIVHYGGASERVRSDKVVRLLKAKMLLIDKHFPPSQRRLGRFLLSLWPRSRLVFALLRNFSGRRSAEVDAWRDVVSRSSEWSW